MTTRGGPRPGAGRKPMGDQKRKMLAVRIPPDVMEWLREQPESQSALVERVLRKEMTG